MNYLNLLVLLFFMIAAVQPLLQARYQTMRRARQMAVIEKERGSRVITMIHRQEMRSIFGIPVSRMIDLEDAQQIIPAIQETPAGTPIDLILHTPGGMVLAAMQIARAVKAHPGGVTVHVPIYAMSGGTLIALAADEIAMDTFSVLGPIDPQIAGLPAAGFIEVKKEKASSEVNDLTLILASLSEKALRQVKAGALELVRDRLPEERARSLAETLAGGYWTHDYALTAREAQEIGLNVKAGIPPSIHALMRLYPQPVRYLPSIEFLPTRPARTPLSYVSGPPRQSL
jgi:ClpP class serine protease